MFDEGVVISRRDGAKFCVTAELATSAPEIVAVLDAVRSPDPCL